MAFDSIDRDMLWKILWYYGVPSKIIKIIQVLYEGFQARVMYEKKMTEPIEMKTGDVFEAPSFPCSTRLGNKTSLWQEQDRDTVYHA